MTSPPVKNLFLAEHKHQVEDMIDRGLMDAGQWIALGPSAMHCLSIKGIPCTIPEDYCSPEEVEHLCVAQFERLKIACERMDEILLEKNIFLKKWRIRPFLFHLWQIGSIFDLLSTRLFQLKRILNNFPGAMVYIHTSEPRPWAGFGIGFDESETVWGRLLALRVFENDIVLLPEPSYSLLGHGMSPISKLKKWLVGAVMDRFRSNYRLFSVFCSIRRGALKNTLRLLNLSNRNGGKNILILNAYDWEHLLPSFVRQSSVVSFFNNDFFKTECASRNITWHSETESLWKEFCGVSNVEDSGYLPLIKDRICWIIEKCLDVSRLIVQKAKFQFEKEDIGLVLCGVAPHYFQYVVKQYFMKNAIPTLMWQHGAVWFDKRITQRGDIRDKIGTSVLLTYGEKVKKAYEASDHKTFCRLETVGSISLDKISRKKAADCTTGKRLLYVITNYYGNSWYCGFSPPFSDRLYFQEQTIIIDGLKDIIGKMNNVHLTVKLCPDSDKIEDPPWCDVLTDVQNIHMMRHPGFVDLLNNHDVIIIDSPTTTLLQAIATRLPVFALTSIICPPREDIFILQKRAVCSGDAETLIYELTNYLITGHYLCDVNNREYLKLYGTYTDDSGSAIRGLDLLQSIL
jgi:hypothetical protein